MIRPSLLVAAGFLLGCLCTAVVSGCSKAADRTLTIYQFQDKKTYSGKFKIDTSTLPADAVRTLEESGGPGDPVTRIERP